MNKTKKISLIVLASLLAVALLFGAVLGIVYGVKSASYTVYLNGVGLNRGVTNYLVSYYKSLYMQQLASSGISVSDTPEFWDTKLYGENTYGSYLYFATKSYLEQLVCANVIFDEYTTLSSADEREIRLATEEILTYRNAGIKKDFNASTAKYGFDFDDFFDATVILYKGWAAKTKIFGSSGENMTSFPEYLKEYFYSYTSVKLIFIRTADTFVFDEEGNRVKGDDGNDLLAPLTDGELAERAEYIEKLEACVAGINSGEKDPEQFDALADEICKKYREFDASYANGVYFNSSSSFTKEFAEMFEDVVSMAFSIEDGEAASVDLTGKKDEDEPELQSDDDEGGSGSFVGMCYMLSVPLVEGAYSDKANSQYFEDFNSLAAAYVYQNMINEYVEQVEFSDKWNDIIPKDIPYNSEYVARF